MSDLVVESLEVRYGGIAAVRDVSVRAEAGRIVALVGANGAGKSSTMRAVMGLVPATGSVWVGERQLLRSPAHRRAAAGIAFVPEGRGIVAPLSVEENLLVGAYGRNRRARRTGLAGVFPVFPVLERRRAQAAGSLSGGEQQMLAVGRAMMAEPAILLLDEPSMGLAPSVAKELFGKLRQLANQGVAVLLADENAQLALSIADEVCVMRLGQVVWRGATSQVSSAEEIAAAYFGA